MEVSPKNGRFVLENPNLKWDIYPASHPGAPRSISCGHQIPGLNHVKPMSL